MLHRDIQTCQFFNYLFSLNENTIQCALRSADISDCHLFVVCADADPALCCGNAHEDKIVVVISTFIQLARRIKF